MKNSVKDNEPTRKEKGIYRSSKRYDLISHLGIALEIVDMVDYTTTVIVDNTFKDTLYFYDDLSLSSPQICNNIISDKKRYLNYVWEDPF